MTSRPGIPFFDQTLRGVVVDGALGRPWVEEAARVAARWARVVVVGATEEATHALETAKLRVLAAEAGIVVAARG